MPRTEGGKKTPPQNPKNPSKYVDQIYTRKENRSTLLELLSKPLSCYKKVKDINREATSTPASEVAFQ